MLSKLSLPVKTLLSLLFLSLILLTILSFNPTDNTKMTKEYTLKINQTVSLSNSDNQVLNITLDSIDFPETQVPGNRPTYHISLVNNNQSENLLFDPFNSDQIVDYFGFNFQITTDREDPNILRIIF